MPLPLWMFGVPAVVGGIGAGLSAFGIGKGRYEQVGGPSDEDIERGRSLLLQAGMQASLANQRAALGHVGAIASRRGLGRSGMLGAAVGQTASNTNQQLQQLALDAERQALAARAQQRFAYQPGWAEKIAQFGGGLAGAMAPVAAAAYANENLGQHTPQSPDAWYGGHVGQVTQGLEGAPATAARGGWQDDPFAAADMREIGGDTPAPVASLDEWDRRYGRRREPEPYYPSAR